MNKDEKIAQLERALVVAAREVMNDCKHNNLKFKSDYWTVGGSVLRYYTCKDCGEDVMTDEDKQGGYPESEPVLLSTVDLRKYRDID